MCCSLLVSLRLGTEDPKACGAPRRILLMVNGFRWLWGSYDRAGYWYCALFVHFPEASDWMWLNW